MENVLTVRRTLIEKHLPAKGISTENSGAVVDIINDNFEFIPRESAENDPNYKQIIPYVVICRKDEVFVMRRLKKGGESRLHGLLSLGVGGHINSEYDLGGNVLENGMRREINEEVFIEKSGELTARGLINDDQNEVGRVHLGLFFTMETQGEVSVRETEKLEGFWVKRHELPQMEASMETWSQLVIPML
ncbi:MAG: NUDIX domain-containing protein [Clostridiales bacterium]|nr:NUDIX domain-containing protein [Clostridiales bacterium]